MMMKKWSKVVVFAVLLSFSSMELQAQSEDLNKQLMEAAGKLLGGNKDESEEAPNILDLFGNKKKKKSDKEKKTFKNAQKANTIEAYQGYLQKYENGKYAREAREKLENLHFEQAKSKNTLASYDDYLKQYPNGRFVGEANNGKETIWFEQAKAAKSIAGFDDYVKQHPNGKYLKEVQNLRDDLYFSRVKELNSQKWFVSYLTQYPQGRHVNEAIQGSFQLSKGKGTAKAYETFMTGFSVEAHKKVAVGLLFQEHQKQNRFEQFEKLMDTHPSYAQYVPGDEGGRFRLRGIGPEGMKIRDLLRYQKEGMGDALLTAIISRNMSTYKVFTLQEIKTLQEMGLSDSLISSTILITSVSNQLNAMRLEIQNLKLQLDQKK